MASKHEGERVPVNKTGQTCAWCGQVKTGYRKDKSLHYLFKFRSENGQEIEGLFCSMDCMRLWRSKDKHA